MLTHYRTMQAKRLMTTETVSETTLTYSLQMPANLLIQTVTAQVTMPMLSLMMLLKRSTRMEMESVTMHN